MHLCDSHCHLESAKFDIDRPDVINRAYQAGVEMMVSCGSDIASSERQVELAAAYEGVFAAVGIHGHEAGTAVLAENNGCMLLNDAYFERIKQLASLPKVIALGELGLDYHYEFAPRATQQAVLARQLSLAVELNLPVILHNRESDADLMRIVASVSHVRGVLHCFLGDAVLLEWAVDRGFYIGVAGPVTYPRMDSLALVLKKAPLDRLLMETDAPYLSPQAFRGQRNEPALVVKVAEKLGQILGITTDQVADMTYKNARQCFGVPDAA